MLPFFRGHPLHIRSFRDRWSEVRQSFDEGARARAAEAMRPTSKRAESRIERFVREGGALVTTGQQAGLFGGPLLTLYKALSAARLAEELERVLGCIVLPLFWIASEDHDWEEVNHTYVLDASGRLQRIGVTASGDEMPVSMSEKPLGIHLEAILDKLAQICASKLHTNTYLKLIRDIYQPEKTVAKAFEDTAAALLADFDLCLVDAANPVIKAGSGAMFRREIEHAEAGERAIRETTDRLSALGYAVQVPILEDASNLFIRTDAGRERLFRHPRGWLTRESGTRFNQAELHRIARETPERLSPNVLLRPVVEASVFPSLAYVAGPGETAYLAQTGPLFTHHGVGRPVVFTRHSATLVDPGTRRVMEKLGIELDDLPRPRHELWEEIARRGLPEGFTGQARRLREAITREYRLLGEAAGADLTPSAGGRLGSLRNRALSDAHQAERVVLRDAKRRAGERGKQLDRVYAALRPGGEPQERVHNALPWLARYGPGLLREIAARMEIRWEEE